MLTVGINNNHPEISGTCEIWWIRCKMSSKCVSFHKRKMWEVLRFREMMWKRDYFMLVMSLIADIEKGFQWYSSEEWHPPELIISHFMRNWIWTCPNDELCNNELHSNRRYIAGFFTKLMRLFHIRNLVVSFSPSQKRAFYDHLSLQFRQKAYILPLSDIKKKVIEISKHK